MDKYLRTKTIKELKTLCRQPNLRDDWFTARISRKVSLYFTKIFLMLGMTANQVTMMLIFIGMFGAILTFTGNIYLILAGILILIFNFILDACDGEVAMYRKNITLVGIHIDQVQHYLLPKLYFFGIAFSIFLKTGMVPILIFGLLCVIFSGSVVLTSLCWELVKTRMEDMKKKRERRFIGKKEGFIGETKHSHLFMIPFRCPYDKLFLLMFILMEILNLKLMMFRPFMLLYFFLMLYGIGFLGIQTVSFIYHYKNKTIESYYNHLYGDKK